MNRRIYAFILVFSVLILGILGCSRPQYGEDKHLLVKNTISFEKQKYVSPQKKQVIHRELGLILPTNHKKNYLLNPESPVFVDSAKCEKVAKSMRNYLNQKGYYNAKSSYSIKYKRNRAWVTYKVQPNELILIDTVHFVSLDSNIQAVMQAVAKETFLKPREALDKILFDQEKARLTAAIRKAGYEQFSWEFITFEGDSVNVRKQDWQTNDQKQSEPRAVVYVHILPYSDTMPNHPKSKN
jgi:hypothetical protein